MGFQMFRFSNKWSGQGLYIGAPIPNIKSQTHWNGDILKLIFPMVHKTDVRHFVSVWKMDLYWKTDETPTIRILKVFGIPAPI